MVHDVDADAVMDLAEDAVVTVKRGQGAAQVAPLLCECVCVCVLYFTR